MGLLSKRRPAPAADDTWREDGTGITSNGDCGGDIQRGDSYSVRFTRVDKPGSLITVIFYAVEYDECPGEFGVQRQVEWMVCEDPADPGGTEIWSEESYDDVNDLVIDSEQEAEAEARQDAERALTYADIYGGWDGEPPWGGSPHRVEIDRPLNAIYGIGPRRPGSRR